MIQYIVFGLNAVVVYALSVWIVNTLEKRRGDELPNRSLAFFMVFFALIVLSFKLLQELLAAIG